MSDLSFAQAIKTSLSTTAAQNVRIELPYDASLRFNRVIHKKDDQPDSTIRSINANQILRRLDKDELDALVKITLACRPVRNGVGMWDVLFNSLSREALTACVFLAKSDYTPVNQDRVVIASQFLNFAMPVTRVHLNRVEVGDKVGVGIYDVARRLSYVLLYEITGSCMVPENETAGDEGRPQLIPAINCQLEQLFRIDPNGGAEVIDVGERADNSADTKAFVEWINDAVNDIPSAFPWKPHFLPNAVKAFDRDAIEARLVDEIATATEVRYEVFEEACRELYNSARARKTPTKRRDGQRRPKPQGPKTPVIEVVNLYDGTIVAKLPGKDGEADETFRFAKSSIGKAAITEQFLINRDLEGNDLAETSNILLLQEDKFGPNAVLRYLSVNF